LWIFDLLVRVKRLEPGVLELAANVQVKARHGRFRVEDRSGRWSMVIRTRFARTIESGRQYTGLSQWPALRVTYTTPSSPRALAAVIRFSHESVRDAIEETVLRESRALRTSSAGGEVA
jgi:hypothetical protein